MTYLLRLILRFISSLQVSISMGKIIWYMSIVGHALDTGFGDRLIIWPTDDNGPTNS